VKFKTDFFRRYLELAPAALALERAIECEMHARYGWQSPILDIGCGDGLFAKVLCAEKIDTGIDLDPDEVERARRQDAYRELIVCPADEIPKPDGSYRGIVSNSVLEHIPDVLSVLKEASRLLAPDGRFYITIPSDRLEHATAPARVLKGVRLARLSERYGKFYNRFWRHHHAYDDAGWRSLFAQAGLEVVEHVAYVPRNLSTFYDLLTVIAAPSLLAKKLAGRWIVWPAWRRVVARPWHAVLARMIHPLQAGGEGCLHFYVLRKREHRD
jgi:SAM-dependent methyltransferase